jgi:hypothetical protein
VFKDEAMTPATQTEKTMESRRYDEGTTPAILRCDYGDTVAWKVSPFGPDHPDRDAYWCETKAEAEQECRIIEGDDDLPEGR